MIPGLVSITFRRHKPAEIIAATAAAGLQTIEWGGDVHVPPGQFDLARLIARRTMDAGLTVAAYGSYYRAGAGRPGSDFESVLETALHVCAPVVRVWAGQQGSRNIPAVERAHVVHDLARCADLAARADVIVAMEFHDDTLNDTAESAEAILQEVDSPHLRTYWQPPHGMSTSEAIAGIRKLSPWLAHTHVFHWWPAPSRRLSLREGRERWTAFLRELSIVGAMNSALLEFMPDDRLSQLPAEAASLRALLRDLAALDGPRGQSRP